MRAKSHTKLQIYLFGGAKGESILLRLPSGGWGLIDCYDRASSETETNSAYRLLQARRVSALEFVCLTHPHEDHYKGMGRLLEDFEVKAFWSFGGLHPPDFKLLRTFFETDARTSGIEESRENARELATIFDLVQTKGITHQSVGPRTLIYPSIDQDKGCQIWGLAPSGRHVDDYRTCLLKSFGKDRTFKPALPPADHNLISSAFLVVLGKTRLILGGDVEKEAWQDVLDDKPVSDLSAHAVKVPHHGSRNGYCPALWDRFAAGQKPVAVLTPYTPKFLPEKSALDHIRPCSSAIHSAAALQHGPDSFPTTSNPRLARIRSTLATRAKARRSNSAQASGFCHLVFDDQGHYRLRHQGDAGRIA